VTEEGFFDVLVAQLRDDLRDAPAAARRRLTDAGRVQR
jgi:hypothetical protein